MSRENKIKLNNIKYSKENKYNNQKLEKLLKDLPEIGMIRIMADNPEKGIHTFILGFENNIEFSKKTFRKLPVESLTIYVLDKENKINNRKLLKEDIGTHNAIKKYGNMNVLYIIN